MDIAAITSMSFSFLPFLIPLLLLPFIMRFVVSRIILLLVKRMYLPGYLKKAHEGWHTEEDRAAIDGVSIFAQKKMRYHFVFQYNFFDDIQAILLIVQNVYNGRKKDPEKLVYSFTFKKLLECLLLAFTDLYREYSSQGWFRMIQSTRLLWFRRFNYLIWFTNLISGNLLIRRLQKTRIWGTALRFLLVPILGIPSLIWYSLRAIGVNMFLEGFYRFFYGIILLKVGYYAIYLYGRNNTSIHRRVREIPRQRIDELSREVEELLKSDNWSEKSMFYDEAVAVYNDLLRAFGLMEDDSYLREISATRHPLRKAVSRLFAVTKKAYSKEIPFLGKVRSDRDQLLELYREIGAIYYPRAKEPFLMFRIREVLEMGYMISLLFLQKLLATPGVNVLLDSVSIDFALKIKSFADLDLVKFTTSRLKDSYKFYQTYRKVNRLFKTVQGAAAPYSLLWNLGSPMVYQQLQDFLRQFVYVRAGRILIYGWETNFLRKKRVLTPLLWQKIEGYADGRRTPRERDSSTGGKHEDTEDSPEH